MDQAEKEYFIKITVNAVQSWLVRLTFWYGWLQGAKAESEGSTSGYMSLDGYGLRSSELEYYWYRANGMVYLSIYEKARYTSPYESGLSRISFGGKELITYDVFGRDARGREFDQAVVEAVEAVERKVREFFPHISGLNSYRLCTTPLHLSKMLSPKASRDTSPVRDVCIQFEKNWLCTECVERFDLNQRRFSSPVGLNEKQKKEFDKLKPALRLSILQRDEYACTSCRKSYLKGDDVKLTVTYKFPVTEGGKTVAENLVTICQKCLDKANRPKKVHGPWENRADDRMQEVKD